MFLSRHNLALHPITTPDGGPFNLDGIYVDPKMNLTVASDGKCLVEMSAPPFDAKRYPAQGVKLVNGETKPFILPAKAAQELLKILPKGKDDADVSQYAALAETKDGKLTLVTLDGKKTHVFGFEPGDGTFPEYAGVLPQGKPIADVVLNADLLRTLLKVGSIGEFVKLEIHNTTRNGKSEKQILITSESKTGLKSRMVQMGCGTQQEASPASSDAATPSKNASQPLKPAEKKPGAPKAAASSPKNAAPSKTVAPEAQKTSSGGSKRSNRRWKGRKDTSEPIAVGASNAQRAFYCYLLRTHGEGRPITVKDLLAEKIAEKIDALKALPALETICATWKQWWKLFLTLLDHGVDHDELCEILNSLTDIRSTSSVIGEWVGDNEMPAETAAAEAA